MNIYKFNFDCGRQGEIYGLFAATPDEVANAIGKTAYFGEVLGKHSDIGGPIEQDEIVLFSDDPDTVERILDAAGSDTICGFNPLHYIEDEENE